MASPHCCPDVLASLATLYAQSRPAMLSRRCLTATAGTSLVRDSQEPGHDPGSRQTRRFALREDASSNLRSLTKIPHCCLRWEVFSSQVAGRPLSPAKDRRLVPTPNPTSTHQAVGALRLSIKAALFAGPLDSALALRTLLPPRRTARCRGKTSMCQAPRAHSPRAIVKLTMF